MSDLKIYEVEINGVRIRLRKPIVLPDVPIPSLDKIYGRPITTRDIRDEQKLKGKLVLYRCLLQEKNENLSDQETNLMSALAGDGQVQDYLTSCLPSREELEPAKEEKIYPQLDRSWDGTPREDL